jgi:hypothetical protein
MVASGMYQGNGLPSTPIMRQLKSVYILSPVVHLIIDVKKRARKSPGLSILPVVTPAIVVCLICRRENHRRHDKR